MAITTTTDAAVTYQALTNASTMVTHYVPVEASAHDYEGGRMVRAKSVTACEIVIRRPRSWFVPKYPVMCRECCGRLGIVVPA